MIRCYLLIFILSFTSFLSAIDIKSNILNFKEEKHDVTSLHFNKDFRDKTINVNPSTQITIQIGPNTPSVTPQLTIVCKVNPLESIIRDYFLCKKKTVDDTNEICNKGKDENMPFTMITTPDELKLEASEADFKEKGSRRKDFNGFYFCRLRNDLGTLDSNFVQIIDENFQRNQISMYLTENIVNPFASSDTICFDSLPIVLHCLNKNSFELANYKGESPIDWNIARSKSINDNFIYLKDLNSADMNLVDPEPIGKYFDNYVYPNGTLVIYKLKEMQNNIKDGTIYCAGVFVENNQHSKIYKIYGKEQDTKGGKISYLSFTKTCNNKQEKFEVISSLEQEISFKANQKLIDRKLVSFYKGTSNKVDWKKDNLPVRSEMKQDSYSLVFPEDIYVNDSGIYTLELDNDLKFTFKVAVTDFPKFRNPESIPRTIYCMHGDSVNILYEAINEDGTFHKDLFIDGTKMDLTNEATLKQSIATLKTHVRSLDISFTPMGNDPLNNHAVFNYTVSNFVYEHAVSVGPSHAVTVNVYNNHGASRVTTAIQVLPIPEIDEEKNPKDTACKGSKCVLGNGHAFACGIKTRKFEIEGIQWRRLWYLNNELIDNHPLFTMELDNEGLTLINEQNKSLVQSLENALVTCRLIILKPQLGNNSFDPTSSTFDPNLILFDSNATEITSVREKMSSKIQFYIEPNLAGLHFLWLIIPIIILIILIVALIVYLKTRPEKEVYEVGKEEERQGHDVMNEIKEKELFHTYERGDDEPTSEDPSRDESRTHFLPKLNTLNRTNIEEKISDNESTPPSSSSVSISDNEDDVRVMYKPRST